MLYGLPQVSLNGDRAGRKVETKCGKDYIMGNPRNGACIPLLTRESPSRLNHFLFTKS